MITNFFKHKFRASTNKYFVENIEDDIIKDEIQKRCKEIAEKIPTAQLINPDKQITTAALDSILFCYDNDTMKEMFVNIMVATIDSTRRKYAHPSFPHILKQLSPADARLFSMIKPGKTYKIVSQPIEGGLKMDNSRYVVMEKTQEFLQNDDTALSFAVLSMLGLISTTNDGSSMEEYENPNGLTEITLDKINANVKLTSLGTLFYKCCINEEI